MDRQHIRRLDGLLLLDNFRREVIEDLERVNLRGDGICLGDSSVMMARMTLIGTKYLAICVIC